MFTEEVIVLLQRCVCRNITACLKLTKHTQTINKMSD